MMVISEAGKLTFRFIRNLSRIATFWVLVAAIVVSEIMDILSPNIAPPMIVPTIRAGGIPTEFTIPIAMGVRAAIVPQLVPIAREIKHEIRKNPGRINDSGIRCRAARTVASTDPIAFAMLPNAPARIKIKHMIIILLSPIPRANTSILLLSDSFLSCMNAVAEATMKATGMGTK